MDILKYIEKNLKINIKNVTHWLSAGGEGAEVVYALRNNSTLADLILNNLGEEGQIKRKTYQRRLPENPNKDYYYIIRESNVNEPLLLEYGFIDNKNDSYKLKNKLIDYGESVVKSLTEYLNIPYTNGDIEEDYYIVKKGDTLYSISQKYNIPVQDIINLNNLNTNNLTVGQKLLIKSNNLPPTTYIVKEGDTLFAIARKYNTTPQVLKELNNLTTNTLSIGQILKVPGIEEEIIEEDEYDIYTVEKNDSLWKISQKYNIPVTELIDINNLNNLTLQIGQKLLVPKLEINEYIIKEGDTLWSIAKKYNISVQELKEINNLNSNLLTVGQVLKI